MTHPTDPIPRITRDDPVAGSVDGVAENVAALKRLFPAIVTDGRVDFDVLRQLLGDAVEEGAERYGLGWKGKSRARAFALTPSLGTLRPARADSKHWDTTANIVIEGDNLEVLKLLRKSYAGRVKLIYIDPPYNTGKDFVYPDNYTDSLANYEALTGQRGADGARLTSNKEASGRFHTDWLNMMYPRLMLAKELLRDDGFIFINIDDVEQPNVRRLCDEVFGEESFVANIVWQKVYSPANDKKGIDAMHDSIVCYAGGLDAMVNLLPRTDKQDKAYQNPDNDPRGPWKAVDTTRSEYREYAHYPITTPSGNVVWPAAGRSWAMNKEDVPSLMGQDLLWFGKDGASKPSKKLFLTQVKQGLTPTTWWTHEDAGHNDESKKDLKSLFDTDSPFQTPKPVRLLKRIASLATAPSGDIILDFFAGSGTTGHAVMAQNAADGGNRRYILVQLPEPLDPAKAEQKTAADFCDRLGRPRTIAELTKERLRRAGDKVRRESGTPDQVRGDGEGGLDTGFRVYKLATSNLKPWQPGPDLAADLLDATDNVLPGRSEDDLLAELLLKTGIDLVLPGETRTVTQRTVHAFGGGTLIVCLADVPAHAASALGEGICDWLNMLDPPGPTSFFFRDSGFDPGGNHAAEAKANLAATLRQRRGDARIERLGAI